MKQTVYRSDFIDAFKLNSERKDQFSYHALVALYDYLTEMEESTGMESELDVVALCCEFAEYESFEEVQEDYPDIESLDELRDNTTVIEFGAEGLIVQHF